MPYRREIGLFEWPGKTEESTNEKNYFELDLENKNGFPLTDENPFKMKYNIDMFANNDFYKHYQFQRNTMDVKNKGAEKEQFLEVADEDDEKFIKKIKKQKIIEDKTEHYENLEDRCSKIREHFKICDSCRNHFFNTFDKGNSDDLMDILIYAITGIFILYLLDIFFKKGLLAK